MTSPNWSSILLLLLSGIAFAQTGNEIRLGDVRLTLGMSQSSVISELSKQYKVGLVGTWKHGAELFSVRDKKGLEFGAVSFRSRKLAGIRNGLFAQTSPGEFPEAFFTAVKDFTARAGNRCRIETVSQDVGESWRSVLFRCPTRLLAVSILTDQTGKKTASISEIVGDAE